MSKKSKRQTRKVSSAGMIDAPVSGSVTTSVTSPTKTEMAFNPDYSYTIKDLKRIGILAGTFFVILIGLAFIMPFILH